MVERRLLISFSGGETSALMTKLILERMAGEYDVIRTVFANTGQENEETLQFVDRCDKAFGLNVIWIEAEPARGKGNPINVVDFLSASRNGEPFERAIQEYGLPGPGWLHCTRELKTRPIRRWASDYGWVTGSYDTAIGIRTDEIDRMSPSARSNRVIYPLVSRFPHTKPKVNEFWARQSFRLNLKGYQGNCKWCWEKSLRKHLTIISENPDAYSFPERMEAKYSHHGAGQTGEPRRFSGKTEPLQTSAILHPPNASRQRRMTRVSAKCTCSIGSTPTLMPAAPKAAKSNLEGQMVELNEKALEQDRALLIHILVVHFDMFRDKAEKAADLFLHDKTLPAPDDGLVERLRYRVENPSAWDTFDQGGSDLIAEATTALQYKDERIERLSVQLEASALVAVELSSRLEAAEQQVQKLTKKMRLIEAEASMANKVISLHRDVTGQGRVKVATAMHRIEQAARSTLKTQEGGK